MKMLRSNPPLPPPTNPYLLPSKDCKILSQLIYMRVQIFNEIYRFPKVSTDEFPVDDVCRVVAFEQMKLV